MASSSTAPWAQQPQPAQPPTFGRDPNSTPTSSTFSSMSNQPQTRKRHADDEAPALDRTGPPDHKRRRPNLANGFQAMSISGSNPPNPDLPPQWYSHPGSAVTDDADEDGLEPTRPPPDGDVGVEVLPDRSPSHSISSRPSFTHPSRPGLWHRSSSFSSTSPSEEDYDSDATFRLPHQRAPPQQPTSVEHPEIITPTTPKHTTGPPHVDYMDSAHKRKTRDLDSSPELRSKRRRPSTDFDMDLPDSQRGQGWYEPEKDRIVVTSLDSPSPERSPELDDMRSRSTTASPPPRDSDSYNYEENRNLSQPGQNGFTISPSLLTHILNAQRDQFGTQPNFSVEPAERGLVLYRPLGGMPAEDVVRQWQQKAKRAKQARPQIPDPDGHRFELVDDDEDLMNGPAVVGVPTDELWTPGTGNISQMDTDMPPPGAGGMDMEPDGDVEMG